MPQGLLAFSTWLPEQHSLWQCTTFTLLGVYLLWGCICLRLRLRAEAAVCWGCCALLQQVLPRRLKAVVARLPRSLPVASRGAIRRVRMLLLLLLLLGLVRGLVHGLVGSAGGWGQSRPRSVAGPEQLPGKPGSQGPARGRTGTPP